MSKREIEELAIVNNWWAAASFAIILVYISGSSGFKAKQGHK